MSNGAGPRSPDQTILMMRVIGLSFGAGVTLFAAFSWFIHQQGSMTPSFDPDLAFNAWLVLFLLAGLGAIGIWRTRVTPILERPVVKTEWRARASAIQTGLIITWALIEGAALFGEVIYFLTGNGLAGVLGVALIWGGVALTWPKQSWLA